MKDKFLSKAYGGVTEARRKLYGLGLPRQWKVITSTLLLLFTFAIGQMWGDPTYHSITPNICGTAYETYYMFNNASGNPNSITTGYSSSTIQWATGFSAWVEGTAAGKDNSGSTGSIEKPGFISTDAGDIKINGHSITFHVTNCTGVAVLGKGNGSSKQLHLSVKEKDSDTEVDAVVHQSNTVAVVAYGKALSASKSYDITVSSTSGGNSYIYQVRFTAPSAISLTGTTSNASATVGESAGTMTCNAYSATSYQWYRNTTNSKTGATAISGAESSTYSPNEGSAGTYYYYCKVQTSQIEAPVGGCEVESDLSGAFIFVNSSTPTHAITYNSASLKGQSVSGYPTEFYEGTGKAASDFPALADVTNYHFDGWSPASIGTDVTDDVEMMATWVAAYNVTFSYGAGGGTVPTSFQKWEGAKFNLPGQGSMTAPSGKVFDGWKAGGTKYAENAEYTMGNDAVEFVAQWKAVPTTLYSLTVTKTSQVNLNNGGAQDDLSDDATIVGGGAYMQNDHANNPQQILGSTKLQFKAGTVTLVMTLTNALKEGDTIKATGLNSEGLCFGVTFDRAGSLDNQLASDASYFIVPEEFEGKTTLYAWRHSGSGTTCASIIIRRPAERPIASTVITLSDLKVNNRSISSDSLATLVSTHSLTLKDEFAAAPEIKFNEHTVITYDDELLPATKVTDKVYTVTATVNGDGKWQASQTINSVAYTVTAEKVSSAKVYYYDGAQKLGEEVVAINGSPVNAGDYDDKTLATFVGWYNNSDLAEEHKIANIAALVVTKDTTVYGKWNPEYATSINIEQWTLTNGAGIGATTKTSALISAIGSHNFAHNLEWVNKNLELDSLNDDPSKTNRNYAYLGLKVKVGGKMVDFRLQNGQTVKVKFGATGNYPQVALNGGSYGAMSLTDNVWTYTADGADAYISIKTPNTNTVVIKQIMINEDIAAVTLPWRVTYDANGGTCATAEAIWSGAALILPDVTPADADHTFAGWYDGETLAGAAGASYNAEANVTLQAHFAPVEYAIAYDGNGATSGSMVAGAAGWGTLVTPATNAFEKTGHIFSGWVITKTSDGSATGITFSEGKFEMPKYDVTLVAQWDDVSKVVKIVETDAKYETFAAAIAAVGADQTIQLLQSCEYSTYWDLDGSALTGTKTVTLDLNGKNLTYTGTKRGVQVSNGAKLVLMDGTATVAPTIDLTTSPMARTAISYTSGTFDSKDGMCALAGSEIIINSGRYLATEGVILVKGPAATATVNDGVLICRDNSVVSGNGTNSADYRNYVMNIHGGILYGEIFSAGYASMVVYHPNVGELNIDGGILVSTNGPCVVTRGGETNITGGTLVALGSGSGKCGDASLVLPAVGIAVDFKSAYPGVASTDVAVSGTVDVTGQAGAVEAVYAAATPTATEESKVNISGGTFNTELTNDLCAPGYVPSAEVAPGVYTVVPKDGICIIKSTPTSGTEADVDGIYQGSAYFKGNAMKLKNEYDYVGVELAAGYTFQAGDKVVLNQTATVSGTDITKFYIFTEVPADGKTYVTVDNAAPVQGDNWFEMPAELVGRSALYIGRINNAFCNPTVGYLAVYRPLPPVLNKVTVNGVEGKPNALKEVVIEVAASTTQSELEAIAYDWVSNSDAWTADPTNAPVAANAWEFGVANTVTFTDKDGDKSVYTITVNKAVPSSDATLSALTVNGQAVALTDGVFDYSFELPYGTTVAPTVVATPNHVAAVATVDPCTLSGATITVVPESGAGDQQVYTLTFSISKWKEIVIWDGSYMSAVKTVQTEDIASWEAVGFTGVESWSYATDEPAGKVPAYCSDNDKTYTHVNSSGKNECNIFRTGGNTKNSRYFKITVPKDYVAKFYVVYGSHSEGTEVTMSIGNEASATASDGILSLTTDHRYLLSGGISEIVGAGDYYLNATASADFFEIRAYLRPGHARTAMLGNGVLGTVCVPNNVAIEDIQGATFYELQGRDYTNYGKLAFDEIISGGLEAGVPYVFLAHGDKLVLFYGETSKADPVDKGNGMYGTFTDQTLTELNDVYYFAQKALWGCADLTSLKVPANRAYVKLSEVGSADPNPAPGRRRISMAVNGEQIATGIENTGFESEAPRKVLINGELYIIRGEKMYDAKGQLVK